MVAAVAVAAVEAGCGNTGDDSGFGTPGDDQDGSVAPPPGFVTGDGSSGGMSDVDTDALGTLVVTPPTATMPSTSVNGVVTVNAPVQFTATDDGSKVAASSATSTRTASSPRAGRTSARARSPHGSARAKARRP